MATTISSAATDSRRVPAPACPHQPDVAAFLLGALTPGEERQTMAHVAVCRTCDATLASFIDLPDLLGRLPLSVVKLIGTSRATR